MATATMVEVQHYCEWESADDFRLINTHTGEIISGDAKIPPGRYSYEVKFEDPHDEDFPEWLGGDYEITLDGQGKIIDHVDDVFNLTLNRMNEIMEEEANRPFSIWSWIKQIFR